MMQFERENALKVVHWAMQIGRDELVSERRRPLSEPADAKVPQIGYIGSDYRPGGPILFAINPGGGGTNYRRTPEDMKLLPMIAEARDSPFESNSLLQVFRLVMQNMRTWNLWRIVRPTLEACRAEQSEVCILNWFPYRTSEDALPLSEDMKIARAKIVLPLVESLAPGVVIALGKKVGRWVERTDFGEVRTYVVPRTIGDSRVSPEASAVLDRIRSETS